MEIKKSHIILLSILFYFSESREIAAQDIQFSQFYAAAPYLNPSFAGSINQNRIIFHQRLQWPALDARYTTSYLSFDGYIPKYKSGYGLIALKDFQGARTINSTELYLQYSYDLTLTNNFAVRPGLQIGYISRTIDYTHLRFPDQFDNDGLNGSISQDITEGKQRSGMSDISSGAIFYSKKFWISYAGHHLNEPDQTFRTEKSTLPSKHSFTTGYKIILMKGESKQHMGHQEDKFYLIPTVHYKFQGKSDQLDGGVYAIYNQFLTGVWYRGIPLKKFDDDLQNNESIVALVGWKIKDLRITYSYDFTVSKLTTATTGGSHELNLTYVFSEKKKVKPMKILPCPNF